MLFRPLAGALVIAAATGLTVVPDRGEARVIVKEKTRYYSVGGSTGHEIYMEMERKGPFSNEGRRNVLATTEFDYDVKIKRVERTGSRCIIRDADVILNVLYTYPKWRGSKRARNTTRQAWKRFAKAVVVHEKQHTRIAIDYFNQYLEILKKTRRRNNADCDATTLGEIFRTNRITRKHERLQQMFDRTDLAPGGKGYEAQLQLVRAK